MFSRCLKHVDTRRLVPTRLQAWHQPWQGYPEMLSACLGSQPEVRNELLDVSVYGTRSTDSRSMKRVAFSQPRTAVRISVGQPTYSWYVNAKAKFTASVPQIG